MANGSEPIKDADGSKFVQVYIYYAAETEKFIERRAATSRYFLTISSALVAILGVVLKYNPAGQSLWLVSLAAAGILVCALWWRIVRSYSVTGARFDVIQAMEKRLPASPYTDEWIQSMKTAYATIKGFEVMRMIRRRHCILIEPRRHRRSAFRQQALRSRRLIPAAERARFCPTAVNATEPR